MSQNRIAHVLLIGCLSACSSAEKKDPLLDEAARYHNEATKIQAVVEPKIERIDSLKAVYSAQKTPISAARIATLDSLKKAFEEWEENVVEVPGMPHQHGEHRDGGPKHNADATLKELPADQMRDLQHEMLNSIRQIQTRLDGITKAGNP